LLLLLLEVLYFLSQPLDYLFELLIKAELALSAWKPEQPLAHLQMLIELQLCFLLIPTTFPLGLQAGQSMQQVPRAHPTMMMMMMMMQTEKLKSTKISDVAAKCTCGPCPFQQLIVQTRMRTTGLAAAGSSLAPVLLQLP
jgi:hypothetical protein